MIILLFVSRSFKLQIKVQQNIFLFLIFGILRNEISYQQGKCMWQDDMFTNDNVTYDDINCTIWQVTTYDNDISLRTSIKFTWISINGQIILYLTSSSITRLALLNLYCIMIYDQLAYASSFLDLQFV